MKQNTRTSRLVGSALALVLAAAAPACLDASDEPTEAPIATLLASAATTAKLDVATWEIRGTADDFQVLGRSASADRIVELAAHRIAADQIVLTALYPQQGTVTIARDGSVTDATTPALAAVGAAVFADIGTNTHPVERLPAGTENVANQLYIPIAEGHIDLGWSAFGYWGWVTVGQACTRPRPVMSRSASSTGNGPFCKDNNWTVPNSTYDCRFDIKIDMPGGQWSTCHWYLQQPIP